LWSRISAFLSPSHAVGLSPEVAGSHFHASERLPAVSGAISCVPCKLCRVWHAVARLPHTKKTLAGVFRIDAMPPPSHEEWIVQLYDRFGRALYRYAVMVLADPAAAADAVQTAFVGLLRKRAPPDSPDRYLRRAVRNECFSALRRRRRDVLATAVPILEAVEAGRGCADERLALERALRLLPPEQREVVHLKVFEGMTFQEIADMTGESINTVASRYRYAIDKLRGQLT